MDELMKTVYQALGFEPKPQPPYPFCCHKDKCIASGRCERTVNGEPRCCAD